jgi:hypothetical protein
VFTHLLLSRRARAERSALTASDAGIESAGVKATANATAPIESIGLERVRWIDAKGYM